MAKELDTNLSKEELKAKKANEKKSQKAAAAKKPKRSIKQYFKDAKSEFKKVVWPTRKTVFNNTVVVLVAIVVSGIAIWGLDSLFTFLLQLLLGK